MNKLIIFVTLLSFLSFNVTAIICFENMTFQSTNGAIIENGTFCSNGFNVTSKGILIINPEIDSKHFSIQLKDSIYYDASKRISFMGLFKMTFNKYFEEII